MPHFTSTTHTERTQRTVDISTCAVPSLGIRGPKSLLTTHSIQQSLGKRRFIRTLRQSLPVWERENRPWRRCMLINWIILRHIYSASSSVGEGEKMDWLSLWWAAVLTTCPIVKPLFSLRFCVCIVFSLYLPKCREWSLTFFSIFATLLRGGM